MLSGRIFTCYITCSDAQLYPTFCDPMDCSTASLCFTISWSLSIGSVIPSNHLILCCSLLLLASIFPSIRVFSSESALHIRWPKYWSFSFSISPSNQYSGLISFRIDFISVQFSHSVMSDSLRPHELQHARPPCPSPTPRVHPNPCPWSW